MQTTHIIDEGIELIIDSPVGLTNTQNLSVIVSSSMNEFDSKKYIPMGLYSQSLSLKISGYIYHIRYSMKVNRTFSILEAYSAAIRYIEINIDMYDRFLAQVAIDELRIRFNKKLKE